MEQGCKFAIIEFGECEKTEFVMIKGTFPASKEKAHIYWYPDEITNEEAICEVTDLIEHYENIALVSPVPEHLNLEALKSLNRPESEATANGR